MNRKARAALNKSIAHWKRMRDANELNIGEMPSGKDCPLCSIYQDSIPACAGCPVQQKTGKDFCVGTPFEEAYEAWGEAYDALEELNGEQEARAKWRRAAAKEIKFLESLK